MYDFLNPQNQLPPALLTALQRALDAQGSGEDDPAIRVAWTNLLDRPIANTPSKALGVRGDLIVADAQSLKTVPASQFTADAHGNLQVSPADATTIMDFGTREAWLDRLNTTSHMNVDGDLTMGGAASNIHMSASLPNFRLHTWGFNSNVLSNSTAPNVKLEFNGFSESLVVSGSVQVSSNIVAACNIAASTVAAASNIITPSLLASNVACGSYTFSSNAGLSIDSNVGLVRLHTASNDVKATVDHTPSYLAFKTKQGALSEVLQFSADSNGTLFCLSNLQFPLQASIRAETAAEAGVLRMAPGTLRFITENNNTERINLSYNSNGLFLIRKASLYRQTENQLPITNYQMASSK
jgi:hypothetical protein